MLTYRQARAQPMLSAEEERELVRRWREVGDLAARDRIVATHMRLCYSTAARWASNEEHIKDLAQEGVFGLMQALDRFDPAAGTRFATYARHWIKNSIGQHLNVVSLVVDIAARSYRRARGGGIEDETLSWESRQASRGEVALDAPVGEDGEGTLVDTLREPRPDPEAAAMDADKAATIKRSLADAMANAMTTREAAVLARRCLAERPETLEQIANDLGVSRERIRQIEDAATRKLRRHLVATGFPAAILRS